MTGRGAVIVGGGQAGARMAQALRREGWQDKIVLLAAEPEPPYERPPLSKDVLTDNVDPARYTLLGEEMARDLDIDMRLSSPAARLEPDMRRVALADGETLEFDRLVFATGTAPRELPTPGGRQFANVVTLRTAEDARRLRPMIAKGGEVVLIGGGFIGLEVAASAVAHGCSVTVLEAENQVMGRMVCPQTAAFIAAIHRAHGVTVRTNVRIEAFEGVDNIRRVRLTNGKTVQADVVVVGVGALPQDTLARLAGLDCAGGILVGPTGETSAPGIYAVGDVARYREFWGNSRNVRLESWENAELQPKAVARAIVGKAPDPRGAPWFWTDQYNNNLQILGFRGAGDTTVDRGDLADETWTRFTLRNGRIIGAVMMNRGRDRRPIKQLIDRGVVVDPGALCDVDTPLADILAKATSA